jgi:hypothetical protein
VVVQLTAELLAVLVALAIPVITLVALVHLFAGVRDLERWRDELIALGPAPRYGSQLARSRPRS